MKTRSWWSGCIIVLATSLLVSCGEIQRTVQTATQPCPQGNGPVSTSLEFCLYVTSVQLIDQDTKTDVGITIVNRTGRRLYLVLSDLSNRAPMLLDNSGVQWNFLGSLGISYIWSQPTPLEPNGELQASVQYNRGRAGVADVTFSLRGALSILATTSQGEPISFGPRTVSRGFNISGLRPGLQQSVPSPAVSGKQP